MNATVTMAKGAIQQTNASSFNSNTIKPITKLLTFPLQQYQNGIKKNLKI